MAVWTRTEDENYVTFTRADNLAGYKVSKHGHCHAEQWMPWSEAPEYLNGSPADHAAWFAALLEQGGHTVTGG